MKTITRFVCLFVVGIFAVLSANTTFAQTAEGWEQIRVQKAFLAQLHSDPNDPFWGAVGDWRFRGYYVNAKSYFDYNGIKPLEPKDLHQWLADTKEVFEKAEANLGDKGSLPLLMACQKMRETGIVFEACYTLNRLGSNNHGPVPEVLNAAYPGPFMSQRGYNDVEFVVQVFCVMAYDELVKAYAEYWKIYSQVSDKTKMDVMLACFKARDKGYEIDHWQNYARTHNKAPACFMTCFASWIYLYAIPDKEAEAHHIDQRKQYEVASDMKLWKETFNNLDDLQSKRPIMLAECSLVLDSHGLTGQADMLTRNEFVFIHRLAKQAYERLKNPLKDSSENSTYWERDADGAEPPLLLKVCMSDNNKFRIFWNTHCIASILFKQLRNDWSQALSVEGIADHVPAYSPSFRRSLELDRKFFPDERNRWREIPAEKYAKSKCQQDIWLSANPDDIVYRAKMAKCARFQEIAAIGYGNADADIKFLEQPLPKTEKTVAFSGFVVPVGFEKFIPGELAFFWEDYHKLPSAQKPLALLPEPK